MKNTKVIMVLVGLIALGAGFGGGYYFKTFQQNRTRGNFMMGASVVDGTDRSQRFVGNRTGVANSGMMRDGAVTGTIISMDDKLITVKLIDGSSKIVLFSTSTTYANTVVATKVT